MSILERERWADDHWDYVEAIGAEDEEVPYEDADQRLGGYDSPYEEDVA